MINPVFHLNLHDAMRSVLRLSGIILTLFVCPANQSYGEKPGRFVLLELFTSEGCSSCPAADRLLTRIAKENPDREILPIAYHVDYWNHLGWADPFSKQEFTRRQEHYAATLGVRGIYTPQVVINGSAECVGSDETALRRHIRAAEPPKTSVSIRLRGDSLSYVVSPAIPGTLNVAVVQKYARNSVARGENSGRILEHTNIVISLEAFHMESGGRGTVRITRPAGNSDQFFLAAFLESSSQILGGAVSGF